jgi:hypothetical protein
MALQFMTNQPIQTRPLPNLAFRTAILTNPNTARSVQDYADSLASEYPEQQDLIIDIADAARVLKTQKDRATIRKQLVDLERYLETSR